MTSSMDTRTWHDQKPSRLKRSRESIAYEQAETMKWDAAEWLINKAHETDDDPSLYYEAYNKIVELS